MDGNSSNSEDDIPDKSLKPVISNKKLKLNDGSSQEGSNEADSNDNTEPKLESKSPAVKSEEASSSLEANNEDPGPSNEVVNAGPSTSNIHAFLLNIRRQGRNYRKRKTPNLNSDSSSNDSDDLSDNDEGDPSVPGSGNETENHDEDDANNLIAQSDDSDASNFHMSDSSDNSNDSYYTNDMVQMDSSDTNSDEEEPWQESNAEDDNDKDKMPSVLLKSRPKHDYLFLREIINREMGLTFPSGREGETNVIFKQNFYGSLNAVYRLQKSHNLNKHKGCVNAINFHPEGKLLASGSDDMSVIVWDWARNVPLQTIKTGHKSNVFQSKFLYLNARSQLNIVTCARDGQVRLVQCPPSGAGAARRRLAAHSRAAHKLHVCAAAPHSVLSAGEDGLVLHADVREEQASRLFQVKSKSCTIPLYSVHGHPIDTQYLVVAGRDRFVRVYDKRKAQKPVSMYCPSTFHDNVNASKKRLSVSMMHLTCAVYNHDGTQILGSYNDEDIYLFDTRADVHDKESGKEGFTQRFSGHRNSATFKGVAFFGPRSEFVVSGSDCAHVYVWDARSAAIVQWMPADDGGVVNCIEAHPCSPVLATSGLDKDVKIWMPTSEEDPKFIGMKKVVRENSTSIRSPLFNDFLPSLYSVLHGGRGAAGGGERGGAPPPGNIEFDGNVCTAF